MLDVLGSMAFKPVKSDMVGNITVRPSSTNHGGERDAADTYQQKIRERQLAAPTESTTIQELVINELKTKKHVATEGLVWLVRYLPLPSSYYRPPTTSLHIHIHKNLPIQTQTNVFPLSPPPAV